MPKSNYEKENIQVLSDIRHIILRKNMYIGEGNDPKQLLSEIIDNGLDEVQVGYSNEIIVYVDTNSNEYRVRDFGRGIPHGKKDIGNGVQKEVLEVLLTKSNSGGKFDNKSYSVASGLHGLGLTITNALSNYIEITSYRDGKYVKATAHASENVELEYGKTKEKNGTDVRFQPNKGMFHSDKIPVDFIKDRCRVASALGFRARLIVDDKEIDTNASMFDLIKEDEKSISTYANSNIIDVTNSLNERMRVALRYTSDTTDRYFGYTNLLVNYLGGTHIQELSKAITASWRTFISKHKNMSPSTELKDRDFLVGLRGVCAVFIGQPEYSSQTKEKLVVNKKMLEELMLNFQKAFCKYLNDDLTLAQRLLKRFEEYRIAQNALLSRKEISSIIKINDDASDNIRRRSVVSKLVECTSKKRDNTEMFIVEGDSALGPYKSVRNKEFQAVLPLKGKIMNVVNKSVKEALKNNEIVDIANAIGAGIGESCDASKSRYERIILSADADVDGYHITCLLVALFVNLFPDIIKSGKLYMTTPPLYCWSTGKGKYAGCNKIEDIPANVKEFHRIKGLGEFQDEQLNYFMVDQKTRNLIQIEYPSDVQEFNRIMGTSDGKYDLLKELGVLDG